MKIILVIFAGFFTGLYQLIPGMHEWKSNLRSLPLENFLSYNVQGLLASAYGNLMQVNCFLKILQRFLRFISLFSCRILFFPLVYVIFNGCMRVFEITNIIATIYHLSLKTLLKSPIRMPSSPLEYFD